MTPLDACGPPALVLTMILQLLFASVSSYPDSHSSENCPESWFCAVSCYLDLGGGQGWNAVWSCYKLYMAIMCSLSGGPGDILCLHRFPRDVICLKDSVSAFEAFQV